MMRKCPPGKLQITNKSQIQNYKLQKTKNPGCNPCIHATTTYHSPITTHLRFPLRIFVAKNKRWIWDFFTFFSSNDTINFQKMVK